MAVAAVMSALWIMLMNNWFLVVFLMWLFSLFFLGHIGRIPLTTAMAFLVFFTFYIPSKVEVSHPQDFQKQFAKDITIEGQLVSPIKMDDDKVEFILEVDDAEDRKSVV